MNSKFNQAASVTIANVSSEGCTPPCSGTNCHPCLRSVKFLQHTVRDYQMTTKFQSFASARYYLVEAGWQSHSIARSAKAEPGAINRRYQKVNLGRGHRPADLTGPYFLRHSLADGTRPWEHVGDDLDEALDANVPVVRDQDDADRTKIADASCNSARRWSIFLCRI